MLLGAARHLASHRGFDGTIHFIFQPAEEGAGGAAAMIEDGLFEHFPVETVWGMHNFPTVPVGHFITRTGPFMASSDTVRVEVKGVGGHGAMPHLARSPVNAACAIIEALNDFVAQEIDAQHAATFTVGRIHGGDAINVIPDSVEFAGTVRSFSQSVRDQFDEGLQRIVHGICAARGIDAEAVYERNYPPLINHEEETAIAARAAAKVVGAENVDAAAKRIMGSEDFAFMLLERPGNYIMIGNGRGRARRLHGPQPPLRLQRRHPPHRRYLLGRSSRANCCPPTERGTRSPPTSANPPLHPLSTPVSPVFDGPGGRLSKSNFPPVFDIGAGATKNPGRPAGCIHPSGNRGRDLPTIREGATT